ncbi:hypothetical protein [Chroococcidiopsis thermalis]|uniref:Uncharacterized protein n=1 Tax=Chroococcidiopsis thermalis (strain PCC 7203) TaxID=251229 RepID=K9UAD2_CHRTP|nr:hypothetical protein [Chroococcidiopsis thermalis]AFY91194.1 hypothetical protein Chro_5856 [Chroococcidiopsis thermalis PCC 7203]
MTATKEKKPAPQLLSYGKSIPNSVGVVVVTLTAISSISLVVQLANLGAAMNLNRYTKGMTIVQLQDGTTIPAQPLGPNQYTNNTIKKFVSDSMVKLFNWDGLLQSTENGEVVTKKDEGVNVEVKNKGLVKIPTKARDAAFALSEKHDFRASFLRKLTEYVPPGLFNGNAQVALVPRYFSEPRQIGESKWEVDAIATLVTFSRRDNAGKGMAFNKTIVVQKIDSPQSPPDTTDLAKTIYSARKSGLEIVEIYDFGLGKPPEKAANTK